jgi:hypothetical protein
MSLAEMADLAETALCGAQKLKAKNVPGRFADYLPLLRQAALIRSSPLPWPARSRDRALFYEGVNQVRHLLKTTEVWPLLPPKECPTQGNEGPRWKGVNREPGLCDGETKIGLVVIAIDRVLDGCVIPAAFNELPAVAQIQRGALRHVERLATACLRAAARQKRKAIDRPIVSRVAEHDAGRTAPETVQLPSGRQSDRAALQP